MRLISGFLLSEKLRPADTPLADARRSGVENHKNSIMIRWSFPKLYLYGTEWRSLNVPEKCIPIHLAVLGRVE